MTFSPQYFGGILKLLTVLFVVIAGMSAPHPANAEFDHSNCNDLLQQHVRSVDGGKVTQVDYAGMAEDAAVLSAYLAATSSISRLTFDLWPMDEQLAFLINVYNAATISLILNAYPELKSIRDTGSLLRSPWSRSFVSLFGSTVSLDNIEHDMIRGWNIYHEPRIHFAVNCAAIGCPPLRAEAYSGATLRDQLDDNTRLFLSDRARNYADGKRIYISKIFDWYAADFSRGWQGIDSVSEFLQLYGSALNLDAAQHELLAQERLSIRHLDYDWGLNRAD